MSTNKYGPSADEMREFAKHFTKESWELCCSYPDFLDAVSNDIKEAGLVAMLIFGLHGYYDDDEPPQETEEPALA